VSASEETSYLPTPPPKPPSHTIIVPYGPTIMLYEEYIETERYFQLFQDAIADMYPWGGCSIGAHEGSGKFVIRGSRKSDVFKFAFDLDVIKYHYATFRLLNDFNEYLAHVRGET
jgi:hypothetical protein